MECSRRYGVISSAKVRALSYLQMLLLTKQNVPGLAKVVAGVRPGGGGGV